MSLRTRIDRHRVALVLACALAACRASEPQAPAELRVPAIETHVSHYAGSTLSGIAHAGSAARLDSDPARALAVRCDIVYVEREIEIELPSVTARARIVAGVRGDEPIRSTSELTTRAQVATGEAATELFRALDAGAFGRTRAVTRLDGVLPPAATVVFTAQASEAIESAELGPVRKHVQIEVVRGAGAAEGDVSVSLTVEDFAAAADVDADGAADALPREVLRRECVVLADRPTIGGPTLTLVFPSPFRGEGHGAFAASIALEAAPSDVEALARHAELVAQCLRDATEAEELAQRRTRPVARDEARERQLASALESLKTPASRRAALVFLGAACDAEVCGDLALCSDDATLEAFVGSLDLGAARGELGFVLERATLAFLANRKSAGPLAPELSGLLARHAGEVGRSASGIEDVLASATDLASLRARIVAENRVYLGDSSIGARVRAFDWLERRELAPAGFDPLAPVAERRAALEAAEGSSGGGR